MVRFSASMLTLMANQAWIAGIIQMALSMLLKVLPAKMVRLSVRWDIQSALKRDFSKIFRAIRINGYSEVRCIILEETMWVLTDLGYSLVIAKIAAIIAQPSC